MSKIAEQIQKLKEQEEHLKRETRKVEFLSHILSSAREYEHESFVDVKTEVVTMLDAFVKKTIEAIEAGTEITITVGPAIPLTLRTPAEPATSTTPPQPVVQRAPEDRESVAAKANFAIDNRHLGGKKVAVINDKNIDIRGTVVGLDAPFVLVKTDTGPTIKVPLEKVSLQ